MLLDLDGTLTDSEPGIVASLVHAFAASGLDVPERRRAAGDDRAAVRDRVAGGRRAARTGAGVSSHYRDRYEHVGLFENRLYDGVAEMLDALVAARHHARAGDGEAGGDGAPNRRALRADASASRSSPVPPTGRGGASKADVIEYALRRAGVDPGPHVVMVGDRDHDVLGAHAHSIDAIGVTWGYGTS